MMNAHNNSNKIDVTTSDLALRIDKTQNTVEQLAIEMRKGFSKIGNKLEDIHIKIEKSVDDLATSVASGFKESDMQFAESRKELGTKATVDQIEHLEDKLVNRVDMLEGLIVKDHGTRIRRVERKLQLA